MDYKPLSKSTVHKHTFGYLKKMHFKNLIFISFTSNYVIALREFYHDMLIPWFILIKLYYQLLPLNPILTDSCNSAWVLGAGSVLLSWDISNWGSGGSLDIFVLWGTLSIWSKDWTGLLHLDVSWDKGFSLCLFLANIFAMNDESASDETIVLKSEMKESQNFSLYSEE